MTASVHDHQRGQLLFVAVIAGIVSVYAQTVWHWIAIKRSDFNAFLESRTFIGAIRVQLLKGAAAEKDS